MAGAGWPVFPLAGAVEKNGALTCSCWKHDECISPAKHPLTYNGFFDATTDADEVRGWARQYRVANIGLRTGVTCDVLDLDEGGLESLIGWTKAGQRDIDDDVAEVLHIFDGPVARTGKGFHLYVKPTGTGNGAKLLPGVDWRGDGGYVVVPPSHHVNGTTYEWLRKGKLLEAPDWLEALLHPPTCDFVLRSGRVCGESKTHAHKEVTFTSSVDQVLGLAS